MVEGSAVIDAPDHELVPSVSSIQIQKIYPNTRTQPNDLPREIAHIGLTRRYIDTTDHSKSRTKTTDDLRARISNYKVLQIYIC